MKIIIYCLFFVVYLTITNKPASAQTPDNWQTQSVGLKTTNPAAKQKTGGLGMIIQMVGQTSWPFLQLHGGVKYYGSFSGPRITGPTNIDLGEIKIPTVSPVSNNELSDWAHDAININSSALSVTVSRLSPAILINASSNVLRFFSGNLNGATITNNVVTNRTPAPAFPKWVAYSSGGSIHMNQLSTTALSLPVLDNNWILVWYGSNSYFTESKKPLSYTFPLYPYAGAAVSLPMQYAYQADAPILFTFANNPVSITQSPEGGIDLSFSGNASKFTAISLFGRDYPKSTDTESWGISGSISSNTINKINFWSTRLTSFPTTVAESYSYNTSTDTVTITENITFTQIKTGGVTFSPIPPFLALARNKLDVTFSGRVVDSLTPTEFGPIQGVENTTSYHWSISGLKKYTDSTRVLGNGSVPQKYVDKLTSEVNKIIQAGHLAPWMMMNHVPTNSYLGYLYWANPADTLYHLAEVYPVLSPDMQTSLANYLRTEKSNFPPETIFDEPLDQGAQRNYLSAFKREASFWRSTMPQLFLTRVPLYSFYGLNKYYEITGENPPSLVINALNTVLDNDLKEQDWATMYWFAGLTRKSWAVENSNRHLAGLIGAAKLLKKANDTEEGLVRSLLAKSVVNRIALAVYPRYLYSVGLTDLSGLNPDWMPVQTRGSWFGFIYNYNWTTPFDDPRQVLLLDQFQTYLFDHSGFTVDQTTYRMGVVTPELIAYKDMVPETARLLKDTIKDDSIIYLNKIKSLLPHWYMAFSEAILGNEHGYNAPSDSFQLFLAQSLIATDTPQNLARYASFSWLETGDLFYLQKLAETIKAYRGWTWSDVGPAGKAGDINLDGQVDIIDMKLVLSNFRNPYTIFDLSTVISNFGK